MPTVSGFLVFMAVGVPIAFVLILSAIILIVSTGDTILFRAFHQQLFGGLENYGLLALPLFMLVGELMGASGIASRLVAMANGFIYRLKGGLAYVNLLANALMAAILGSAAAQISMMNRIMTPEMEKAGYSRAFSASLSTGGGLLAPVLPPSMIFVVYGVLAQVSIGDMFIAGIIPGLMMVVGFILAVYLLGFFYTYPDSRDAAPVDRGHDILTGLPTLLVPIVIVASITLGLATPTESAALASVTAIVIGVFVYKQLTWDSLQTAFVRAAISSGVILILIAAAQLFGFVITYEQIPGEITDWMTSVANSPITFLLLLNLMLLFVGMFIDAIAALIIVVPLMLPIAVGVYGVDPFHFGVIVCLNLAVGLVTPPVGAGLFVAAASSGVRPEKIALGVLPFILVTLITLVLISVLPSLTTVLL